MGNSIKTAISVSSRTSRAVEIYRAAVKLEKDIRSYLEGMNSRENVEMMLEGEEWKCLNDTIVGCRELVISNVNDNLTAEGGEI